MALVKRGYSLPKLPDRVPTHWNAAGEINGWSNAFQGAFLLPIIMVALFVIFFILPKIDPKKNNYRLMDKTYWLLAMVMTFYFCLIHLGSLGIALGYINNMPGIVTIGIGLLFVVLGNYFGKIKPNYFVGIKTPWTLASEEVWNKTHRMAGPYWVIGGLAVAVAGFLPQIWSMVIIIGVLCIIVVAPIAYSYYVFRKINH